MNITRLKTLAGIPLTEAESRPVEASPDEMFLNEVVKLPDDVTMEDLIQRMDACKRAMSLANKLTGADRKKWLSATFVNMNKIRAGLRRLIAREEAAEQDGDNPATPAG